MDNKYLNSTNTYHDVSGLQRLRTGAKNHDDQALEAVAKQLEGTFLNMMLKSMREANSMFGEDNPLNSKETEFYQSMFDQQISLTMAQGKGIGLADVIVRQMRNNTQSQQDLNELMQKNALSTAPLVKEEKDYPLDEQPNQYSLPERKTEFALPLERVRSVVWGDGLKGMSPSAVETKFVENKVVAELTGVKTSDNKKTSVSATEAVSSPVEEQRGTVETVLRNLFPTAAAFVDVITPYAQAAANELGVDVKAIVAQAALETGWGQHVIKASNGSSSLNFFGIKSNHNWAGDSATVKTLEYKDGVAAKETADFRAYKNMDEAFQDYISFLKDNPRYKQALENTNTAKDWGFQLQKAGYATDPEYGKKIASIVSRLSSSDKN